MAVTAGQGRRILWLCSLTKEELWGHSRVLPGWRLGTGNRVYPLSCWEQLPFSGSLLSPVKQAHNSHWRWWDYVLLSGEKQSPGWDRGWGALGPPWCPISAQPFVCLSAEHSEASFKRTIQPWELVPWLLRDNFSGSRLIASSVDAMKRPSNAHDVQSWIKMVLITSFHWPCCLHSLQPFCSHPPKRMLEKVAGCWTNYPKSVIMCVYICLLC